MKNWGAHLALAGAILVSFGVSSISDRIDPYYLRVIVTVGINIVLAVSLNLVNGYTGQFSLGHAGFMCIGAYASAVTTMVWGRGFLDRSSIRATFNHRFYFCVLR